MLLLVAVLCPITYSPMLYVQMCVHVDHSMEKLRRSRSFNSVGDREMRVHTASIAWGEGDVDGTVEPHTDTQNSHTNPQPRSVVQLTRFTHPLKRNCYIFSPLKAQLCATNDPRNSHTNARPRSVGDSSLL